MNHSNDLESFSYSIQVPIWLPLNHGIDMNTVEGVQFPRKNFAIQNGPFQQVILNALPQCDTSNVKNSIRCSLCPKTYSNVYIKTYKLYIGRYEKVRGFI